MEYQQEPGSRDEPLDDAVLALRAHFDREIANAPPIPAAVRESVLADRSPGRPRLFAVVRPAAAAVLVVAVGVSLLLPQRTVDASPAAVIARAADQFLRLRDAVLSVSMQSKVLNFLTPGSEPLAAGYRVDIQAPNRFVMRPDGSGDPRVEVLVSSGFDGEFAWVYDRDTNEVEISKARPSAIENIQLTQLLGFSFVRGLQEREDELEIAESTTPLEARAGWRSFELLPLAEHDGDGMIWTSARFVIDPARDLILRYELEVSAGLFSVFDLTVELVDENVGFTPGHFRFERYVPDGVTLRQVSTDEVAGIRINQSIRITSGNSDDDEDRAEEGEE